MCKPISDVPHEAVMDAFEQRVVDDFFGLVGEHDLEAEEAYSLIGRISESLYTSAQERYA